MIISTAWGSLPLAAAAAECIPSGGDRLRWQAARADLMIFCTGTIVMGHPPMGVQQESGWFGLYERWQTHAVLQAYTFQMLDGAKKKS